MHETMQSTGTRILNAEELTSHGNVAGREAVVQILEAGLQACDPYYTTKRMLRIVGNRLIVGNPGYQPTDSPTGATGEQVFDLDEVGRIYVFAVGKGIQRAVKAFEEILGDRLTGGHVIAKYEDDHILERIPVTYGAHPVPDDGCVEGCLRIVETAKLANFQPNDIVFTIGANGISSLMTLPVDGITLEEVRQVTYLMQIEKGVPTRDLNRVRNHIDRLKGGQITRLLRPARLVHIVAHDMDVYEFFASGVSFVHFLPDFSYFADAIEVLNKWQAWDLVPESVRQHLLRADPAGETMKRPEFEASGARVWCSLPRRLGMLPAAEAKARELGFEPHRLATWMHAEAKEAGYVVADIALNIVKEGMPFAAPCALFSGGELLVTVGKETGMGGRNQEYTLAAALRIAGQDRITLGAVDSDGTDGPGGQFLQDGVSIPCLAGGIVDGRTVGEAKTAGVDIYDAIRRHDTSPALWKLRSGVLASHSVSMTDLSVTLISK